jgi:predicted nucleic acid-binding protein
MILIADASALIALSVCNSLPVLDALFGTVLVPQAVYFEVAAEDKPHSEPLRRYLSQAKEVSQSIRLHFPLCSEPCLGPHMARETFDG